MTPLFGLTQYQLRQVMDFSEAERRGFIEAFVEFWRLHDSNHRTVAELEETASSLLRGCRQHFSAAVTRIQAIHAVIPPAQAEIFRTRVLALLDMPGVDEFLSAAMEIRRDFPATKRWLAWWMRKEHAAMLFVSHRTMDAITWESIPATSNAEEAMHWTIYVGAGKQLEVIPGILALWSVGNYFDELLNNVQRKSSDLCICSESKV